MKPQDRYLKFVRWEDEDGLYVGYCPDLFPFGGVCHGATEEETYRELAILVAEEVAELQRAGKELPPPSTRPMREAVPARPAGPAPFPQHELARRNGARLLPRLSRVFKQAPASCAVASAVLSKLC